MTPVEVIANTYNIKNQAKGPKEAWPKTMMTSTVASSTKSFLITIGIIGGILIIIGVSLGIYYGVTNSSGRDFYNYKAPEGRFFAAANSIGYYIEGSTVTKHDLTGKSKMQSTISNPCVNINYYNLAVSVDNYLYFACYFDASANIKMLSPTGVYTSFTSNGPVSVFVDETVFMFTELDKKFMCLSLKRSK